MPAVAHHIDVSTKQAITAAVALGLSSLRAEPPQRLSDWACEHFRLAGESSHQKGGWTPWPFQIGWMDAFSNDDIEHCDVQKSKRVGYTKTVAAFVAYNIAHRRRKQAVYQPTDDDRDSFVKSEIEPVLSGIRAVRAARKQSRGRRADTIGYKQFRDSVAHFLGGKAARAYRRITVAVVMLDEWSGFDQVIEKSADPGTLARGRLEGAPYPKFVGGSTPRVKGKCHVERSRLAAGADMRYCIRCPHCSEEHPLLWGGKKMPHGMKWDRGDPSSVRHVCPHCGAEIRQADYLAAWVGAWVCQRTGLRYGADRVWRDAGGVETRPPKHVAFQVWAAYSPQRDWSDIVDEFEKALLAAESGNLAPMQGFVNETLAETWELPGDRADEHELQKRVEPFALCTAPPGAIVLTAGVDLQGNRWEIGVWGWARGLESWTVDHHVIEGNPQSDEDWEEVATYLRRRYPRTQGGTMGIDAITLDANFQTQAALNFVRLQQRSIRIMAGRGEGDPKKPIKGPANTQDVTWRGEKFPRGVKLWQVGVKAAKDLTHGQLKLELTPGKPPRKPGYVHFSNELTREWFEQLTSEQRILVTTPTGAVERWVKRRPRNEVLDTRVYALHAAYVLGIHRWNEKQWAQAERRLQLASPEPAEPPPQAEEEGDPAPEDRPAPAPEPPAAPPAAAPPAPPPTPAPTPQPARRGRRNRGRIGGWR